MKTTLVVTTYNRPEALALCLESIKRQKVLPGEVIIGDDGSKDETRRLIDSYREDFPVPLVHVWQEDKGFRAAKIRNKAVAQSTYDYIIQIDGDVILHPRFIADHIRMAKPAHIIRGKRVRIGPWLTDKLCNAVKYKRPGIFSRDLRHRENAFRFSIFRYFVARKRKTGTFLGVNMAYWKSDFIAVNGYDEYYEGWGCEDVDLAARMMLHGCKRVNLQFGGVMFHLWHPEASRSRNEINHAYFSQIADRLIRCRNGVATTFAEG